MGGKSSSSQYQHTTTVADSYNRVLTQNVADVGNIKINLPDAAGGEDKTTLWLVAGAVAVAALILFRR
jgi:hypothetical protein